jgi:hypothetical protein
MGNWRDFCIYLNFLNGELEGFLYFSFAIGELGIVYFNFLVGDVVIRAPSHFNLHFLLTLFK